MLFILNFILKDTIKECTDISDLWYKEFYLELSKKIQVCRDIIIINFIYTICKKYNY